MIVTITCITPFNFFLKFTHCLTLLPIFLVQVNDDDDGDDDELFLWYG